MSSDIQEPVLDVVNTNNTGTVVLGMRPNSYCMLMHLSQLLGWTGMPIVGWAVPIVLWAIGKDESEQIDQHGKNILNWMISAWLYALFAFMLCFIVIGIPILAIIWILSLVFPIIGAVNANAGKTWKYPLSIPFFK